MSWGEHLVDDTLAAFLREYIQRYRDIIISHYSQQNPPLLIGKGAHEFDMLSLIIPTMNVGPLFGPIPGGSFSTDLNVPKYPANTTFNQDNLKVFDINNPSPIMTTADGHQVPGVTEGFFGDVWKANHIIEALIAGGGTDVLEVGIADMRLEVIVTDITVSLFENALVPAHIEVDIVAAAGGEFGHVHHVVTYLMDLVNSVAMGDGFLSFPMGSKIITNAVNQDLHYIIAGGLGNEQVIINYYYRYVV